MLIDDLNNLEAKKRNLIYGAGLLVLLAVPLFITNTYLLRVAIMVAIYIVLASSLNIIIGFTGMFSLGHGAFYGIGAYTSALLAINFGLPFWITMPLAGIMAAAIGAFLGLSTLRLRHTFLVFGTLAFGEIVRLIILNWNSLTRGPRGIPGIPAPQIFGFAFEGYVSYYYLMLVFTILVIFLIYRIYKSRIGRAFLALREDERAANSMGINVFGYKVLAFSLACFFAGLTGAFYAHLATYISADQFGIMESFLILSMVAIGGTGSIVGPIIGGALLMLVPEIFRFLADYRMAFYGVVLIIVIVVKPEGIAGIKAFFPREENILDLIFKKRKKRASGETA